MPIDELPEVPDLPAIQIAGLVGASHTFDEALVQDVVFGGRVARGPWAVVVQGRVGVDPDRGDPLALTVAEIATEFGMAHGPLWSLNDVAGAHVSAELGVPAFGRRFSGGPFLSLGVDGAAVRRTLYDGGGTEVAGPGPETLPAFGVRLAAGASWCLGKHVAVRAELSDLVRDAALIEPTTGFGSQTLEASSGLRDTPGPAFMHQVAFTLTVAVGG